MLDVWSARQGALRVAVDFSPELDLATVVLLEVRGDVVDH